MPPGSVRAVHGRSRTFQDFDLFNVGHIEIQAGNPHAVAVLEGIQFESAHHKTVETSADEALLHAADVFQRILHAVGLLVF
ncbi:hypothetical protein A1507_20500 [Methylomonas koyamae]|uniref:Uncharacterized protein n=1 Tax=Methylomonas koyamae TaxID=702114 RepID=A0A177N1D3_9GAMM|nr:hypothetical protein A1507_20500 [Methylomonas koyamae]